MAENLPKNTSEDTHLADDSKRQENAANHSGYAPPVQEKHRIASDGNASAEVTEGTSDDTHLADDSKRRENDAGCSG